MFLIFTINIDVLVPESLPRYVRKVVFLCASKDVPGKKNSRLSLKKRALFRGQKVTERIELRVRWLGIIKQQISIVSENNMYFAHFNRFYFILLISAFVSSRCRCLQLSHFTIRNLEILAPDVSKCTCKF